MRRKRHKKILNFLAIFLIIAAIIFFKYFIEFKKQKQLPKIALVIDDWGYNLNNLEVLRSIDIPLTLAVLPNLKYSKEIAKEAKHKNRHIILHMPMETKGRSVRWEKSTITTKMSREEITSMLNAALNSIGSSVRGVSNHMGSKFTADKEKMDILLRQLREKRLFFFDSVSGRDTVCEEAAADIKVKYIKRDVYLDNVSRPDYIRGQFKQLVEIAKRRGYAAGTGHDRENTLKTIKELIPTLKNKVRFVFVAELAK